MKKMFVAINRVVNAKYVAKLAFLLFVISVGSAATSGAVDARVGRERASRAFENFLQFLGFEPESDTARSLALAPNGSSEALLDVVGPTISYVPFGNVATLSDRVLTVTVTDSDGVPTSGAGLPVLYFRKGTSGAYTSSTCSSAGGSAYSCTLSYAPLGGLSLGQIVQYFVAAQDITGNVSLSPSAGAAGLTANPPAAATPPTIPNSFRMTAAASGSYTVGPGGAFTSLTKSGGAFETLNSMTLTGNVTIDIVGDLSAENGARRLDELSQDGPGGGTFTVTIRPVGGARTITGTGAAIIWLNGADRVIIDGSIGGGGSDRSLTIINSAQSTSAVIRVGGASASVSAASTSNVIRNCILQGGGFGGPTTSNYGIFVGSGGGGPNGAFGADNDGLTIRDNVIRNVTTGIAVTGVSPIGIVDDLVISGNTIGDDTPANSIGRFGISLQQVRGATVDANTIKNVAGGQGFSGVYLAGINIAAGVTESMIARNNVTGVRYTGTNFSIGGKGINIDTAVAESDLTIANNFVSGIGGSGLNNLEYGIVGINVGGATGGVKLRFNSVNLGDGSYAGPENSKSAAFYASSGVTGLELTNNVFANNLDNTATTTDQAWAIALYTPSSLASSDHNDYFATGPAGVLGYIDGVSTPTIDAWRAATSLDQNSVAVDPMFLSATDLHIAAASPIQTRGTAIAGITGDFDGDSRQATPDIGADEVIPPIGTVSIFPTTTTVSEGNTFAVFEVTRVGSVGEVTANIAFAGGNGATSGANCGADVDFVGTAQSVTFADGDAADKEVFVPICANDVHELIESIEATLSLGSGNGVTGVTSGSLMIVDDDAPPVVSVLPVDNVTEGDSGVTNAEIRYVVTGSTDAPIRFTVVTIEGDATAYSDFTPLSGEVTINGPIRSTGGQSGVLEVFGDQNFESDETLSIQLSNCVECSLGTATTTATIVNDDQRPTVRFSSAAYSNYDEIVNGGAKGSLGGGQLTQITLFRDGGLADYFSVRVRSTDGTATGGNACGDGVDYLSTDQIIVFAIGESSKRVSVNLCTDSLFEGDESFNLALSEPTGVAALGDPAAAVVTIVDNETVPTLLFSSSTYVNDDDLRFIGTGPAGVTIGVDRLGAYEHAVSVNYAVTGGTATGGTSCGEGVDYITTSGTLEFSLFEVYRDFNIQVCPDTTLEGDETIELTLSNPSAPAQLGSPNTTTVVLRDNETPPKLAFSQSNFVVVSGIDSLGGNVPMTSVVVKRTNSLAEEVSVDYATSDGTATGGADCSAGNDYISTSGTVTFGVGETEKTFAVTLCPDTVTESNEVINLALSNPTAPATLGTQSTATITISDIGAISYLSFSQSSYTQADFAAGLPPPSALNVTVNRTGYLGQQTTADVVAYDDTATGGLTCSPGFDYINPAQTLTWEIGETSKIIAITICPDTTPEQIERFALGLANVSPGSTVGIVGGAAVLIGDNDGPPSVYFSDAFTTVNENVGSATVNVHRGGLTDQAVSVRVVSNGGNATPATTCGTPGQDFESVDTIVNFKPGETDKTVAVNICNDAVHEYGQNFFLQIAEVVGAGVGDQASISLNINDDDQAPAVTINNLTRTEGNGEYVAFQTTATITGPSETVTFFGYRSEDGTASRFSDYSQLLEAANEVQPDVNRTTETVTLAEISSFGDTSFEGDETFFIDSLYCSECTFANSRATMTIVDDDSGLRFANETATINEGIGTAHFTVERVGPGIGAVSVSYAMSGTSATGGSGCDTTTDFVTSSATLTWANGDVSAKTIDVPICDDTRGELSEMFSVNLQNPANADIAGTGSVSVTISDNDVATPTIEYVPASASQTLPLAPIAVRVTDDTGVTAVYINVSINGASATQTVCSQTGGTSFDMNLQCPLDLTAAPASVAYSISTTNLAGNSAANPSGGRMNVLTVGSGGTIPAGDYESLRLNGAWTLGGDVTVEGQFDLAGPLATGSNRLTLGCDAVVTGAGGYNYVVGTVEKQFCGASNFSFPLGTTPDGSFAGRNYFESGVAPAEFTPVEVNVTSVTAPASIVASVTDGFMPGTASSSSLSRYWDLSRVGGPLTADLTFHYLDGDVVGSEATYQVIRRDGTVSIYPGGIVTGATNTIFAPAVSAFSSWTAGNLAPTAAGVEVGGRVRTAGGEGIGNVTVILSGGQLTEPRVTRTSSFGAYRFENVDAGETYVITVRSARYGFAQSSRIVNLTDSVFEEDFTALPD